LCLVVECRRDSRQPLVSQAAFRHVRERGALSRRFGCVVAGSAASRHSINAACDKHQPWNSYFGKAKFAGKLCPSCPAQTGRPDGAQAAVSWRE
jgi:hypothetical protein